MGIEMIEYLYEDNKERRQIVVKFDYDFVNDTATTEI